MNKSVAVILSGCGALDGAEINEVVLMLLALEEHGLTYQCFAPDIDQHNVINHITGEAMPETRNVLVEAARIVRDKIKPITECHVGDYSGLVVPGGFGVAKNLSDFAFKGEHLTIQHDVLRVLKQFKDMHKPVGYLCIAPALLPIVYGEGVKLTIGNDQATATTIENMGGKHVNATVHEVVFDPVHKVLTTPCYMLARSVAQTKSGIDALVSQLSKLM